MSLIDINGELNTSILNSNFQDLAGEGRNDQTIKQNADDINEHKNSSTAHSGDSITNPSGVAGAKITDALNTLNTLKANSSELLTKASKDELNNGINTITDALNDLGIKVDKLRDKPPVDNVSDLSATYPTPQIGDLVYVKGINDISERNFYLYIDGENEIQNGENYINWTATGIGSVINNDSIDVVSDGTGDATATLDTDLRESVTYEFKYKINNPVLDNSSLYINGNIISGNLALDKTVGEHTVDITTLDTITVNEIVILLDNLGSTNQSVNVEIISMIEKGTVSWKPLIELIPHASSTLSGLISSSTYNQIQSNKSKSDNNENKVDTLRIEYDAHVQGTSDNHGADKVTTNIIAGQENVESALDNLQNQVDSIVTGGTEVDPRVSQALTDSDNEVHTTLKDRNDKWEARVRNLDTESRSEIQTNTASIFSMPPSTKEGQVKGDVEGLTLHSGVVNGNFANGTTMWSSAGYGSMSVINNECIQTLTESADLHSACRIEQLDDNAIIGNKYFVYGEIYVLYSNAAYIKYGDTNTQLFYPEINVYSPIYGIVTASDNTRLRFYHASSAGYAVNDQIKRRKIMRINMTQLGIEHLTETEMLDLVRQGYFEGTKHNSPFALVSCGENLAPNFDKWTKVTDDYDVYIPIKPSTTYHLKVTGQTGANRTEFDTFSGNSYIGHIVGSSVNPNVDFTTESSATILRMRILNTTIQELENVTIMLSEGSGETAHKSYKSSTVFVDPSEEMRRLPNDVADKVVLDTGKVERNNDEYIVTLTGFSKIITDDNGRDMWRDNHIKTSFPKTPYNWVNAFKGNVLYSENKGIVPQSTLWSEVVNFGWAIYSDGIDLIVPTGEDVSNYYGKLTLVYIMGEAEYEYNKVDGALASYENGTVYVLPQIKENLIATGETIAISEENEDYPIESLVSLEIKEPNASEVTKIDINECAIADDGKSFSHSSIVKGYPVNLVYAYDSALLAIPTTNFTYPLNQGAVILGNTEAIQKNSEKIVEIGDKVEVLEGEVITAEYTEILENVKSVFNTGDGINEDNVSKYFNAKVVDGEVIFGLSGRVYTNELGDDGKCESTTPFSIDLGTSSISIEDNSLKTTLTGTSAYRGIAVTLDNSKYYFVRGKNKNGNASVDNKLAYRHDSTYVMGTTNTETVYKNDGIKLSPSEIGISNSVGIYIQGISGEYSYLDDLMIVEITQDEYNNLTVDQLLEKYPYINGTQSTTPCRINSKGKNLVDESKSKYVNVEGFYFFDLATEWVQPLDLELGVDYVLSAIAKVTSTPEQVRALIEYQDGTIESFLTGNALPSEAKVTKIINVSRPTKSVSFIRGVNGGGVYVKANTLQIEKDSTPTAYEPFKHSYVDVDVELHEVPDGTADRVYKGDDGEYYKDWQNNKSIIDGNLAWTDAIAYTNTYRIQLDGWIALNNAKQTTDNSGIGYSLDGDYPVTSSASSPDERGICIGAIENGVLYIRAEQSKVDSMTGATTLDKFKDYLNTYPVTLQYNLANPVQEKLDITQLTGYSNGQISIKPYLNREYKYDLTNKITLDYEVSDIDKVTDIEDNEYEYSLDADGKTLTITGGVQDAYYRVQGPIKSELSTVPTSKHKARLNRMVTQDQVDQLIKTNQEQQEIIDLMTLMVKDLVMGV